MRCLGWLLALVVTGSLAVRSVSKEEFAAEQKHRDNNLFDVRRLVKGTIDAVAKLPSSASGANSSDLEANEDLRRLFQLPADIMTQIAADAGYIDEDEVTTARSISRKKKHKLYRRVSDDSEEGGFVQVNEEEEEYADELKPRKRKKLRRAHHTPIPTQPDYTPSPANEKSTPAPPASSATEAVAAQRASTVPSFLSFLQPLLPFVPPQPLSVVPTVPPQPIAASPLSSMAPLLHSLPQGVQALPSGTAEKFAPQVAYQPIVQPDGNTYYQQVLIYPSNAPPSLPIPLPATTTTVIIPTTSSPTTPATSPQALPQADAPLKNLASAPQIRRRLITNSVHVMNEPSSTAEPSAASPLFSLNSPATMRPVPITFSADLHLFKPTAPPPQETEPVPISRDEEPPVSNDLSQELPQIIRPKLHGTKTLRSPLPVVSSSQATKYYYDRSAPKEPVESPSNSSTLPIPPPTLPGISLITATQPSADEQAKQNEIFVEEHPVDSSRKRHSEGSEAKTTLLKISAIELVEETAKMASLESLLRTAASEDKTAEKVKGSEKAELAKTVKEENSMEEEEEEAEGEQTTRKTLSQSLTPVKGKVMDELHELVKKARKEHVEEAVNEKPEKELKFDKTEEMEDDEEEIPLTTMKSQVLKKRRRILTPTTTAAPVEEETSSAATTSSTFKRILLPSLPHPLVAGRVNHAERLARLRERMEARAAGVKLLAAEQHAEKVEEEGEEEELKRQARKKKLRRMKLRRIRRPKTTTSTSTTTTTTTTTTPAPISEDDDAYDEALESEEEEEEGEEGETDEFYSDEQPTEADISIDVSEMVKPTSPSTTTSTTTTTAPPRIRRRHRRIKTKQMTRKVEEVPAEKNEAEETEGKGDPETLSVVRPHCINIRSFARQFGARDVGSFVEEHCSFIENYYPTLTCERREEYLAACQKFY